MSYFDAKMHQIQFLRGSGGRRKREGGKGKGRKGEGEGRGKLRPPMFLSGLVPGNRSRRYKRFTKTRITARVTKFVRLRGPIYKKS